MTPCNPTRPRGLTRDSKRRRQAAVRWATDPSRSRWTTPAPALDLSRSRRSPQLMRPPHHVAVISPRRRIPVYVEFDSKRNRIVSFREAEQTSRGVGAPIAVLKVAAALKAAPVDLMKPAEINFDDHEVFGIGPGHVPTEQGFAYHRRRQAVQNRFDVCVRCDELMRNLAFSVAQKRQILDDAVFHGMPPIFLVNGDPLLNYPFFRSEEH